ncbi:MAG: hypothetical protein JWN40_5988 [Phycisphaerales bacterium]|nr:hypothetical protein [Phycisphaerales bacterium]
MRRLLRILLNTATVLSLVLCAATMAAWVRSYQVRDVGSWSMASPRLDLAVNTYRGGLFAGFYKSVGTQDNLDSPGTGGWYHTPTLSYTDSDGPQGTLFNRFGFALDYSRNSAYENRYLACPYWFILLLTSILPAARLAAWRRRRVRRLRVGAGLCQHCGYDCRATPDRCPECGRPTGDETSR